MIEKSNMVKNEIDKELITNELYLLELFAKVLKDKFLPTIERPNYEKQIKKFDDNNNSNNEIIDYNIQKDLGKAINILVDNLVHTTQFNMPQLVNFTLNKQIPIPLIQNIINEFELKLKDLYRKNASEIIEMADKITRTIRINSFPNSFDMDDYLDKIENNKKKRFRHKKRYRS